jgi:hypothetical protein
MHAHIFTPLMKGSPMVWSWFKGTVLFFFKSNAVRRPERSMQDKRKDQILSSWTKPPFEAPRVTSSLVRYKSNPHQQLFTCTKGPFLQYNRYAKRQYPPSLLPLPPSVDNRCFTHNYASAPWELISSGGHIHSRTTVAFGGTQFRNDVNAASGCTSLVPRIIIGARFFKNLVQKTSAYPLCMALINFGLVCSGKRMVT